LERLLVVGTSRARAPAGAVQALFGDAAALADCLDDLGRIQDKEAMVLATPERLEFILARGEDWGLVERLTALLAERAGLGPGDLHEAVYAHEGDDALRHIFAVAASLDSEIGEEPHIVERLERCREAARDKGMSGPCLDAAVRAATAAARRIETETPLAERQLSMAAVATQVARGLHGDPSRCRVLLVGLGELGQRLADELRQAGAKGTTVVHASPRRAEMVARRLGGHFRPWEQLEAALAEAEIVVSDRGTGQWTVTREAVERALRQRGRRPILLIDLGLPCDVEDAVDAMADAFLYRLDDLERIAFEGKAERGAAGVLARRILEEEHAAAIRRWRETAGADALAGLRADIEALRAQALSEHPNDAEAATGYLVDALLARWRAAFGRLAGDDAGARDLARALDRLIGSEGTSDQAAQGDDE
jgi:glutamyl-tRNA reductase